MKLFVFIGMMIAASCASKESHDKAPWAEDSAKHSIDTVVNRYLPLPCVKGIDLKNLYGKWRSIGDKYNDASKSFWIHTIDTAGNFIIDRFDYGEIKNRYSGKIKSINKENFTIDVQGENGITTLEILNLTENCFEYRLKTHKEQVWRLDRMAH